MIRKKLFVDNTKFNSQKILRNFIRYNKSTINKTKKYIH